MKKNIKPSYLDSKNQIQKVDTYRLTSVPYKTYVPKPQPPREPVASGSSELEALKKRVAELEALLAKGSGSFKEITLEEILALQKIEGKDTEDKRELFKSILSDNLDLQDKQ